jgi:PQQ-dependent catabolism-associated CXXCW motif protein
MIRQANNAPACEAARSMDVLTFTGLKSVVLRFHHMRFATMLMLAAWGTLLSLGAVQAESQDDGAFDAVTGYRIGHYRAAVPESVPGGTRVDLDKADALIKNGAILLDVMPSEGAGADPVTGQWRLSRPHQTIPGATWLPDVGRGKLTPAFESYLQVNLDLLSKGDKAKPVVIFCQSDCWMSWNAVRRLAALGYSSLYWFPEGTDGWVEWGDRKLVPAHPVPMTF